MKADAKGVLTGDHYLDGDKACAEGAIAAGCRFLAGYPITPSTEVAERVAERFPLVGGFFIQISVFFIELVWALPVFSYFRSGRKDCYFCPVHAHYSVFFRYQ